MPPFSNPAVQPDPYERALAVFEAFLRYARDPGAAPVARVTTTSRSGSATRSVPRPPAVQATDDLDGATRPTLQSPPPNLEDLETEEIEPDDFDHVPTRVSPLSAAMASTLAPLRDDVSLWDEPTQERPDVSKELLDLQARHAAQAAATAPAAGGRFDALRDALPERRTVIVDEDAMQTVPALGGDRPGLRPVHGGARAEQFVGEMTVLIKYGHADQVARELERWIRTYPEDLAAHVTLSEFELARVDAASGLDRLFAIASRALDRGERELARRVLERVLRDAPGDLRVAALRDRVGRSDR